jgi:hypothetical protein
MEVLPLQEKKLQRSMTCVPLILSLKQIKIPKDYTKEEIEFFFGPIENKNRYHYTECLDPELNAMIKKL